MKPRASSDHSSWLDTDARGIPLLNHSLIGVTGDEGLGCLSDERRHDGGRASRGNAAGACGHIKENMPEVGTNRMLSVRAVLFAAQNDAVGPSRQAAFF